MKDFLVNTVVVFIMAWLVLVSLLVAALIPYGLYRLLSALA